VTYRVDVPGGTLRVTWTTDDRVLLTGPAVVVAWGETDL
jgi:diaminopimelate epimerase